MEQVSDPWTQTKSLIEATKLLTIFLHDFRRAQTQAKLTPALREFLHSSLISTAGEIQGLLEGYEQPAPTAPN